MIVKSLVNLTGSYSICIPPPPFPGHEPLLRTVQVGRAVPEEEGRVPVREAAVLSVHGGQKEAGMRDVRIFASRVIDVCVIVYCMS